MTISLSWIISSVLNRTMWRSTSANCFSTSCSACGRQISDTERAKYKKYTAPTAYLTAAKHIDAQYLRRQQGVKSHVSDFQVPSQQGENRRACH